VIVTGSIAELRGAVARAREDGKRIGLVPTMGYLHEGHLALIDAARQHGADFIVVSVFINPKQFGPAEDLDQYPRDPDRDRRLLAEREVDLMFVPSRGVVYPEGFATSIRVEGVAQPMEGERRPGHFDGVATVVVKLFNMVGPDLAVFGEKDAQQVAVIRRVVDDLNIPVEIVAVPTVREIDGLARSSRNSYLEGNDRVNATILNRALVEGRRLLLQTESTVREVEEAMEALASATPGVTVDYLRVVDPGTFESPGDLDRDLLLVGAIEIGKTRLIDNMPLSRSELPPAELQEAVEGTSA
jgi:pantoate--beta-alanine ligase